MRQKPLFTCRGARVILALGAFLGLGVDGGLSQGYTPAWRPLGPVDVPSSEAVMGRVNCVAVCPNNPDHLYLGTPGGGVWSSEDAGASWKPRSDFLPVLGISSIVIDQDDSNQIYIATGDADLPWETGFSIGVWKSRDGGATWNSTGLSWGLADFRVIYALRMSPTDSGRILAATSDGIYSTFDSGTNWQRTTPGQNQLWYDLQFQPGNSAVIYATGQGGSFFKSSDGGTNWTQITAGLPGSGVGRSMLAVCPAKPAGVYLLCTSAVEGSYYGLYQSVDGGATFSLHSSSVGATFQFGQQGFYDLGLAVSPTNFDEVYAGGVLVGKSTDGGVSWQSVAYNSTHMDIHSLAFLNRALYSCTDGGLHRSTNGADGWQDLSATLQIGQIYCVGGAQQNAALIYAGEQDNGLNRLQHGAWDHLFTGDFAQPIVDPIDENIVYAIRGNSLYKTTNSWTASLFDPGFVQIEITSEYAGQVPLVMDPSDRNTLFAGFENVWKSTNGGLAWSPISSFSDGLVSQAIAVAPSNANFIYVIRGGILWRTTDGGAHWNLAASAGELGNAVDVAISSSNPNKLWVAQNDYTSDKVSASADGGTNWIAYTGSLPERNIRRLIYQNGSNDRLYAGLDAGVFYRDASMADWRTFTNQLPNAPVADLQIHYGSQRLRAATFGRGLWETDLAPSSPRLAFTVSQRNLVLSWTSPAFVLQASPALSQSTWTTVATNSPATFSMEAGQNMWFRLKR